MSLPGTVAVSATCWPVTIVLCETVSVGVADGMMVTD